jgi:hypothetical protein
MLARRGGVNSITPKPALAFLTDARTPVNERLG